MDGTPYAELWLGTHLSGPARLAPPEAPAPGSDDAPLLSAWLAEQPAARLGAAVASRWHGDLPFLLKVLSVAKALSIQAHPDEPTARLLHAARPHVYRDPHHKPEMALALTEFTALVGFAPPDALSAQLALAPEAHPLLGPPGWMPASVAAGGAATAEAASGALRAAFGALMGAPPADVAAAVGALAARLRAEGAKGRALAPHEALAVKLEGQYGGDVGVLAAFFLNLVVLQPGQAVALAANEPHAYLEGAPPLRLMMWRGATL